MLYLWRKSLGHQKGEEMTLFECLAEFQRLLKKDGIEVAKKFLKNAVAPECHEHILGSFDMDGRPLSFSYVDSVSAHPAKFVFQ